ncbi:MAG TPA: tripartite tricarboxylate transporter substrate binding protein [Xanthobacteraceae bacterium]
MITVSGLSRYTRLILLRALYGIALAVWAFTGPADAQTDASNYPDRPIRVIVPYPPGGGTDILARTLAEKLQARWHQPVIVENRAGASGNVGSEAVFRAKPDGYTLLFSAQPPLVANESLYAKLNFNPDALASVSVAASANIVLFVNSKVPVDTLQQFIDYAKANPGKLNYASQGIGSSGHLTGELFSMMAGVKMIHVPYAGTNPAVTDLIAGHVDLMFGEMVTGGPFLGNSKLKLLGLGGEKRFPEFPNVPTISEAVPGFLAKVWQGMVAPPGTPDAITSKLSVAINDALKMPDITDRLDKWYMTAVGGTPQDMDLFLKAERERWGNVIRTSGTKIE